MCVYLYYQVIMFNCVVPYYRLDINPMNDDVKRFIIHRLKWLLIFMGMGTIIVFLLPFPFDLIAIGGLFVLLAYLRSRSEMKRFGGTGGIRSLFGSLSSSGNQSRPLKYYCMRCGNEHKEILCPNCGSKMKRVG
jgi:hypothetical protein